MNNVGYAGLRANLSFAENRLAQHKLEERGLQRCVEEVKEQINNLGPNKFQTVFEEENFIDAIWFLQDEPEISEDAKHFIYWKEKLETKLKGLGVQFNN